MTNFELRKFELALRSRPQCVAQNADKFGAVIRQWRFSGSSSPTPHGPQTSFSEFFFAPIVGPCYIGAMRIIARSTLRAFVEARAGSADRQALKSSLDAWFAEASRAKWKSAADVESFHRTASVINADRIVFNIKGNDYRLVVSIDYEKGIVWIKWIGAHADYDNIDVSQVRHEN